MVQSRELDAREIRRAFKGSHADALLKLLGAGWRLKAPEGHGGRAYCPCERKHQFSFAKTPKDADRERNRILREARSCRTMRDD